MKKKIKYFGILACFFFSGCGLLGFSDQYNIQLRDTMITLEGEEVDAISLKPGDSAILTYKSKRNSTFKVHPEIRKNQTIRLGGYFYRGFNDSGHLSEDQLEWISSYIDILSLNEYASSDILGKVITPEEVQAIKDRNSAFWMYMMVFGTTMIEPLYDPEMMSDWVLQTNDVHEVIGLRRKKTNSDRHVMDMKNQDYIQFFGNYLEEHAQTYNADGVIIDEIMWEEYWKIDTEDIQGYNSKGDYYRASLNFLKGINTGESTDIISQAFWNEAQKYSHGVWGESAFKYHYGSSKNNIFYQEMTYFEIIDNMMKLGTNNKPYIWAGWYRENNIKDLKYVLATYLMGKASNSIVLQLQPFDSGLTKKKAYNLKVFEKEYSQHEKYLDVAIGNPVENPEKIHDGNIWVREYEKGLVYCYPKN